MRRLRRAALPALLTCALLASACGSGDEATEEQPTDAATSTATPEAQGTSADLPEGVAATVGETEIPVEDIQARVQAVTSQPQLEEQLTGDQGEAVLAQIEAQALTQAILAQVVLDAAEAQGIEITEEQVTAKRDELEQQAGGPEEFASSLEQAGVTEAGLQEELRAAVAIDLLAEEFGASLPGDATTPPATADPGQQELQQFLQEQVRQADIVVDEEYGQWVPAQQRVVPDVAPPAPQGALTPQPDAESTG